ncbi:MAG: hypothetical protein M1818_005974 [Claussenomyces sp. TS43310]|nr:MAG: hypothetical protein M1818_005974 [Claussenomyces sp. TS43310]
MASIFMKTRAIETHLALSTCPRGTTGRVHHLRLQRRRHPARGLLSTDSAPRGDLSPNGDAELLNELSHGQLSDKNIPNPGLLPRVQTGRSVVTVSGTLFANVYNKGPRSRLTQKPHGDFPKFLFGDDGLENVEQKPREDASLKDVYRALRTGDSYAILRVMSGIAQDKDVENVSRTFAQIPQTAFSEILRCLDPEKFLDRYNKIFREISPHNVAYSNLRSEDTTPLSPFAVRFMDRIKVILQARHASGFKLHIQDYKYLLRFCRAQADPHAAQIVWKSMTSDSCQPDVECYNSYFAAIAGSDARNPHSRHQVMITPYNLAVRASKSAEYAFHGRPTGDLNVRSTVSNAFDDMVQNGMTGDEETFCLMMVAQAREGDVEGVKMILKRVWRIEVDCLMNEGEEFVAPIKDYAMDSPIHPSETLLMTLAHCFGINNQIPTALRLVDFISRKYSLSISVAVWEELFERTFTLSTMQHRKRVKAAEDGAGSASDKLPLISVAQLWATFVNPPYNIKPTMSMYDKLIRNLMYRQCVTETLTRMEEGRALYVECVDEYQRALRNHQKFLLQSVRRPQSLPSLNGSDVSEYLSLARSSPFAKTTSPRLVKMERELTYLRLRMHRNRQYLCRWCRNFLHFTTQSQKDHQHFCVSQLPVFLEDWKPFIPRVVSYELPTGYVRFRTRELSMRNEAP